MCYKPADGALLVSSSMFFFMLLRIIRSVLLLLIVPPLHSQMYFPFYVSGVPVVLCECSDVLLEITGSMLEGIGGGGTTPHP